MTDRRPRRSRETRSSVSGLVREQVEQGQFPMSEEPFQGALLFESASTSVFAAGSSFIFPALSSAPSPLLQGGPLYHPRFSSGGRQSHPRRGRVIFNMAFTSSNLPEKGEETSRGRPLPVDKLKEAAGKRSFLPSSWREPWTFFQKILPWFTRPAIGQNAANCRSGH